MDCPQTTRRRKLLGEKPGEGMVPEACMTVQVLKAIHQEIIFPAVFQLRTSIYTVLPYKDVKGEWRVRVEVRERFRGRSSTLVECAIGPFNRMASTSCWLKLRVVPGRPSKRRAGSTSSS